MVICGDTYTYACNHSCSLCDSFSILFSISTCIQIKYPFDFVCFWKFGFFWFLHSFRHWSIWFWWQIREVFALTCSLAAHRFHCLPHTCQKSVWRWSIARSRSLCVLWIVCAEIGHTWTLSIYWQKENWRERERDRFSYKE